jgi:hypothetical protein
VYSVLEVGEVVVGVVVDVEEVVVESICGVLNLDEITIPVQAPGLPQPWRHRTRFILWPYPISIKELQVL